MLRCFHVINNIYLFKLKFLFLKSVAFATMFVCPKVQLAFKKLNFEKILLVDRLVSAKNMYIVFKLSNLSKHVKINIYHTSLGLMSVL